MCGDTYNSNGVAVLKNLLSAFGYDKKAVQTDIGFSMSQIIPSQTETASRIFLPRSSFSFRDTLSSFATSKMWMAAL